MKFWFPAPFLILLLLGLPAYVAAEDDPPELKFTRWSGTLNVPDPVAISVDERGRVFVTQTQRRKAQDLDIRENLDWIPNDVSFRTVEEKRAFYRERLAPERSAENVKRVKDHNGDGSHDWRDLMVLSEKIYLVQDTDEDGTADAIKVFAEDFKTEVTGIAAGVLWHEGSVYSTIAPDVWRLRDLDGDGQAEQRDVVAHGFGLHIAYAGHDMHGLRVGPDGRIYWSIGDKGISVLSKEGHRFSFPDQGGVLRCDPDGSNFEVFAHGLRNVQEIAFDEYGNCFGVDNDADMLGEKERFVYIVKGMDAGWRCYYQYRGKGYNPWTADGLWKPHFEGQPAYLLPPICNYEDGPCGFAYNPGTALTPKWRNWFFMTEAPKGNQWAFQTKPNGASFEMINSRQIGSGIALVGLAWGPDGALYGADWAGGYPLDDKGAVWTLDVENAAQVAERQAVKALFRKDLKAEDVASLTTLLGHADQRIRLRAQFELVRRQSIDELSSATASGPVLKRIHGIWGLGQLARQKNDGAVRVLASLLNDPEPEIRAQALKTIADLPRETYLEPSASTRIAVLITDPNPRVRFFAAQTAGVRSIQDALPNVLRLLEENNGRDLYLRFAGIDALAGIGGAGALANHPSEAVRLAAVVALRRNGDAVVADFLLDASEAIASEAARAIHDDDSITAALPALAARLNQSTAAPEALLRRALNAQLRLGAPANALEAAKFAANAAVSKPLRLEALQTLLTWTQPNVLDRVDGRHRPLPNREAKPIADAIAPQVSAVLESTDNALLEAAMTLAGKLEIALDPARLDGLVREESAKGSLRAVALSTLKTPAAVDYALTAGAPELRIAAARLLATTDPARAVPYLGERLEKGTVEEKQAALGLLAGLKTPAATALVEAQTKFLIAGKLPAALQLDVLEAAQAHQLTAALSGFDALRPAGDPNAAFFECLEGGSAERGEVIFSSHLGAQCTACHKVSDGKGSIVGPNLKVIAEKGRPYLLESLILPGVRIAEGYGTVLLTMKDGSLITGQFRKETDKAVELRDVAGEPVIVPKDKIAERSPMVTVMPPMSVVLSKREIRDMVAYLATLKEKPKGAAKELPEG